jgi:hypothetical protein
LGETNDAHQLHYDAEPGRVQQDDLEDIEPEPLFEKGALLRAKARALIVIVMGVPNQKFRIVSNDKKTDCTEAITAHEQQHADDIWKSWSTTVLDGMARALDGERLPKQLSQVPASQESVREDRVYVDITADYYFATLADAQAAQAGLKKFIAEKKKTLFADFAVDRKRRADQLHQTVNALDGNCKPVLLKQSAFADPTSKEE